MMKPRVNDSDFAMCRNCSGTGTLKETSNHRVFDTECVQCKGEGWVGKFNQMALNDVAIEDVEAVSGKAEVNLQKEVLNWVKKQYGNDEKKIMAFLRFTRAYGRCQCDAKEYHDFLRSDFSTEGALYITPKLAKLVKEKQYRVSLLKYNAAIVDAQESKKKAAAEKASEETSETAAQDTDELTKQVGIENNIKAFSVDTQTGVTPPVPPPIS